MTDDFFTTSCAIFLGILIVVLLVWSLVWVYNDAEERGKSGCLVVLLVFLLSWPVSLLAWIVFRPEHRIPR
jgi:uncharacterized membrane protein